MRHAELEAEWKRVAIEFQLELTRGGHGGERVLVGTQAGARLSLRERAWGISGAIQDVFSTDTSFVVCDGQFLAQCQRAEAVEAAERTHEAVSKLTSRLPDCPACLAFTLPHRQNARVLDGDERHDRVQLFPDAPAELMPELLSVVDSLPSCFKVGAWRGIVWVDVLGTVSVEEAWSALTEVAKRCKARWGRT